MEQSAVKGVKGSSREASGNNWGTPVEEIKTARSRSPTGTGVSTVGCRNVSPLE